MYITLLQIICASLDNTVPFRAVLCFLFYSSFSFDALLCFASVFLPIFSLFLFLSIPIRIKQRFFYAVAALFFALLFFSAAFVLYFVFCCCIFLFVQFFLNHVVYRLCYLCIWHGISRFAVYFALSIAYHTDDGNLNVTWCGERKRDATNANFKANIRSGRNECLCHNFAIEWEQMLIGILSVFMIVKTK